MASRFQPIYDIAAICAGKGIQRAVLCPGSRNAPLTLAFARHPNINTFSFSDERSAAFVALGMAQQTGIPVALVCTSGTAAYNFAPAIAEAYFSLTPLIVVTADRPSEWIAQQDGQTIYQYGLYGSHVKKAYQLPQNYDHPDEYWETNRIVNEAINLAQQHPCGPVHINAPFREPLYPDTNDGVSYSDSIRLIGDQPQTSTLSDAEKATISSLWSKHHNILIVGGQMSTTQQQKQLLSSFSQDHQIPIIGDIISNNHGIPSVIRNADLFLGATPIDVRKSLRPDLLITFGGSVISKNVKLFLRSHPPKEHWHILDTGIATDTFQALTHVFHTSVVEFFGFLTTLSQTEVFERQKQNNYCQFWEVEERRAARVLDSHLQASSLSELSLVADVIDKLPPNSVLHLANSMSVRYANFVTLRDKHQDVRVYSNRGTSGIDGCTSTAVGHALADEARLHVLITGDMAFFYDRNAFWHNYKLPNLRILLLNNHGGIIFDMLDGPSQLPEAEAYFITQQNLHGRKLCEEFDFDYLLLDNQRKLKNLLKDFFDPDGRTKVLELSTAREPNKAAVQALKLKMKESYDA